MKLSKKLVTSVLTLVLTAVALGAATFAWFVLRTDVNVTNIDGKVDAKGGLEVSFNNTDWFYDLDLSTQFTTPVVFDHLTSTDGKVINGYAGNGSIYQTTAVASHDASNAGQANANYIQFELYFRSPTAGSVAWDEIVLTDKTAASELKVGSMSYGSHQLGDALRVSISNGTDVIIWERATSTNNIQGKGTNLLGAHAYYLAVESVEADRDAFNSALTGLTLPATVSALDNTNTVLVLGAVSGGFASGSVTVSVWAEGWDANTINALFTHAITIALSFVKIA